MSRIFWDSMLFIYFFEAAPEFGPRTRQILSRMNARGDRLLTSTLAMGETLVGPRKTQSRSAEDAMMRFFRSDFVELVPFSTSAALRFADIRARWRIPAPDAVHLACAAEAATDIFVTNDASLIGKTIPGIHFIVGLDTDLF